MWSYTRQLQYHIFIMVAKQKMGCWFRPLMGGTVRALAASLMGLSSSVHANSCSHICTKYTRSQENWIRIIVSNLDNQVM